MMNIPLSDSPIAVPSKAAVPADGVSVLPRPLAPSAVLLSESHAKATKGKAGTAVVTGHVRRSTAGTGLRVGESDAELTATSEFMDVTAGETAPNSVAVEDDRSAPALAGVSSLTSAAFDTTVSRSVDAADFSDDASLSEFARVWLSIPGAAVARARHMNVTTFFVAASNDIQLPSSSSSSLGA